MIRKPRIDRYGHVHPPRRAVPVRLLITVAVLLAIGLGAGRDLQEFVTSFQHYKPPAIIQIEPGSSTTPVAQRAVLIIVSGLRSDVSREMPTVENLRRQGSQVEVYVPWPTIPQAAWITLLSGVPPELSGAIQIVPVDDDLPPINGDHLLRRARVTRHTTALTGHKSWESMIPAGAITAIAFAPGKTADDDARLVQQSLDILTTSQPDLMVIQLSQVDTAGDAYGGASDEYYRAVQRADALVRRVASSLDLRTTVLAVTSDHGHLDQGGYGGPEPSVSTVPLILAGAGVKPGDHGDIDQSDVAPTLAALLGLPLPAESQGTIRFEMLDIDAPLRAEKAITLAEQQVRLSDAYLRAIGQGGASGKPAQTLSVARSAWDIGNVEGAFEIAIQSDVDSRQEMTMARRARIAEERRERLRVPLAAAAVAVIGLLLLFNLRTVWLVGTVLLAWFGPLGNAEILATLLGIPDVRWSPAIVGATLALAAAVWAWRSRRWERLIIAVAVASAGAWFTYAQPVAFAPSAISSLETFRTALAWRSIAALLIGGVAVLALVWPTEQDAGSITRTSYWFVFLLIAGLFVELAAGYWRLGLGVTWYLPEANLVYWHLINLMQTMLVAGLGVLLPAIVVPVTLALRRLRPQSAVSPHAQPSEVGKVSL
ncbi:MAG: alkaline phosphatase family protein [Anaerolineae bacterium]